MIQAKCIRIIKDTTGSIKTFVLADTNGNTKEVTPEQLKQAVQAGKINVINLQLKQDKQEDKYKNLSEEKLYQLIQNAKGLGLCKELETRCKHKCYLASLNEREHILYIPDDVTDCRYVLRGNSIGGRLNIIGGRNVVNIDNMFDGMNEIKYLNLSRFNTSNIIYMNNVFDFCRKLEYIDLSNIDTSKVESMVGMFKWCRNLKCLDLSSFNTSKVKNMSYMFEGCWSLESLDLSSFDTSNVTDMRKMFHDCNNLKSLNLLKFNTNKIINEKYNMGDMFNYCNADLRTKDRKILRAYNSSK